MHRAKHSFSCFVIAKVLVFLRVAIDRGVEGTLHLCMLLESKSSILHLLAKHPAPELHPQGYSDIF